MKRIAFILFLISLSGLEIFAQNRKYYLYENKEIGFSFNCPITWVYIADKPTNNSNELEEVNEEQAIINGGKFISQDKQEANVYLDCFDGIIFYVAAKKESLDSTLLNNLYIKKNNKYYGIFGPSPDTIETEDIKGENWKGIHHFNTCRIYCKEDNVTPLVDGCEFIYFSNNQTTVSFITTGKEIDGEILKTILMTFKFTNK